MPQVSIEQPPQEVPRATKDYLNRQFINVNTSIIRSKRYVPRSTIPDKVAKGDVYYFEDPVPAGILAEGLYIWNGTEWIALTTDNHVIAGYGGITMDANSAPLPSLGIGWQVVTSFDAVVVDMPIGITQDFANNAIEFNVPGMYMVTANITFSHEELNDGRFTRIRIWLPTLGKAGRSTSIATGRNAGATNIPISGLLFDVTATEVGIPVQLQLGGGDVYDTPVVLSSTFSAVSVGEKRF